MNKADFDRKYKAIKGHMLNEIIVKKQDEHLQVVDVYWSATLNKLVIVVE